jgi:predicted DsbA family dithiol-disulfide isomerase
VLKGLKYRVAGRCELSQPVQQLSLKAQRAGQRARVVGGARELGCVAGVCKCRVAVAAVELHPAAIRAHEASRCAGEQDRFWQMHTRLFSAPGTHGDDQLRARAQDAGLDLSAFDECLASGRTTADIRQVGNQAMTMGASGTPAFFLGVYDPALGQVRVLRGISGAQPYEVFAQTLDLLLQQVQ